MNKYLEKHRLKNDHEAPLWLAQGPHNRYVALHWRGATKLLRRMFKNAGIQKRCNPHSFRHSRATELANTLTEVQLSKYLGWVVGTRQVSTYVHMSGRQVDDAILALNGVKNDVKERQQELRCVRCGVLNVGASFCKSCGFTLSATIAITQEDKAKQEMEKTLQYFYDLTKDPDRLRDFEAFTQQLKTKSPSEAK